MELIVIHISRCRGISTLIGRWQEYHRQLVLTEKALNWWIINMLRTALTRWDRAIEERQLNRELTRLAGSHWRGGVIAIAWRAWREAPMAAALAARAKRHAKRQALARALRRWYITVASLHLDFHENLLAVDHRRRRILGTFFPRWINVARVARVQNVADRMSAVATQHWDSRALAFAFERWRDEVLARREDEEHRDRAAVHRLWRLGVDCCRAWRRHARQRAAEEAAYDVAASLHGRRHRRRFINAWLRHTLAAYVGRESAARRAIRTWRRNAEEALDAWEKETAAEEFSRYRRRLRSWQTWLDAWLLEARSALAAETRLRNLLRGAVREWGAWARRRARDRANEELAAAHHRARTLRRCFAALAHSWARKVLSVAFEQKRRQRIVAAAWVAWRDGRRKALEALWTPFIWWAENTYTHKLQRLQEERENRRHEAIAQAAARAREEYEQGYWGGAAASGGGHVAVKQAALRRAAKAAVNKSPSGAWRY